MRKNPVRTSWALAAAGALGLTGTALAQHTTPASTGMPVSAWHAKTSGTTGAVPLSPSHACLAEMQVELAWLADSMTFPYPMAARIVGTSLEVGGIVSTEAVHQRVLYLAREYSGMKVADHLHVQPTLAVAAVREPDGVLARNAAEAVSATFAKHARTFEVKADAEGGLSISGNIPSYEEKLAVSRRLSRLNGCTCVVNELDVVKTPRDGKQWVNVSADGIQQVPDELVRRPLLKPSPPAVAQSLATSTTPSRWKPANTQPSRFTPPAQVLGINEPAPAPTRTPAPLAAPRPYTSTTAVATSATPASPYGTIGARATNARDVGVTQAAYQTPAAAPKAASPLATPPAASRPAAPRPMTVDALLQLRKQIEVACGYMGRNVQVAAESQTDLKVRVQVRNKTEGSFLAKKVLAMPELQPYRVTLAVTWQ